MMSYFTLYVTTRGWVYVYDGEVVKYRKHDFKGSGFKPLDYVRCLQDALVSYAEVLKGIAKDSGVEFDYEFLSSQKLVLSIPSSLVVSHLDAQYLTSNNEDYLKEVKDFRNTFELKMLTSYEPVVPDGNQDFGDLFLDSVDDSKSTSDSDSSLEWFSSLNVE